jgi:hypothetical protein
MNDDEIEQRVRDFYRRRAPAHDAPDFESMLARAAPRRRQPAWLGAAAAVIVLATLLLVRVDHPRIDPQAAAQLVADLSASTHWTAPSDRWLGQQTRMPMPGVPEFHRMTYQMEEVNAWL